MVLVAPSRNSSYKLLERLSDASLGSNEAQTLSDVSVVRTECKPVEKNSRAYFVSKRRISDAVGLLGSLYHCVEHMKAAIVSDK